MEARRCVIVVGAGVFGAASAVELARRGWRVSLIDPGPLPRPEASSTDISKAIRMDYGSDELYTTLMEEALLGWDAWNRQWKENLYHEDGVLFLTRDALRPGEFEHESFNLLSSRGHRLERLDADAIARRFPAFAAGRFSDGYHNPRGGWAESGRVVARLIVEAMKSGAEVRAGERFERLLETGSRVAGIETAQGERHLADFVVIAAGAWTPALLPYLGDALWSVGQPVFVFEPADPAPYAPARLPVWCADVSKTGWYGFPANGEGLVKVANHGPGMRVHPDDPRLVGRGEEARFREFLGETFPGLAAAPLAYSRLCLYEDSWDGNLWIDHDPDRPGLLVASGGSGHGFKFAPLLGGLIADVLERKPNPYASRFAWRNPGERRTEQARHS